MHDQLLTAREAAAVLAVSEAFLERDRRRARQIPFVRVGNRAVRYRADDLLRFIAVRHSAGALAG